MLKIALSVAFFRCSVRLYLHHLILTLVYLRHNLLVHDISNKDLFLFIANWISLSQHFSTKCLSNLLLNLIPYLSFLHHRQCTFLLIYALINDTLLLLRCPISITEVDIIRLLGESGIYLHFLFTVDFPKSLMLKFSLYLWQWCGGLYLFSLFWL